MKTISWEQFAAVDLRVGTIVKAEDFIGARKPAYKLWIDFGSDLGVKKSSAQITDLYTIDELIGKQIMAVTNFAPKQIGNFMSEVLVTGFFRDGSEVVLAQPDQAVPNGAKLH